jgi:hypothetical protein
MCLFLYEKTCCVYELLIYDSGVGSVLTKDEITKTQKFRWVHKSRVVGSARMPVLYYEVL